MEKTLVEGKEELKEAKDERNISWAIFGCHKLKIGLYRQKEKKGAGELRVSSEWKRV